MSSENPADPPETGGQSPILWFLIGVLVTANIALIAFLVFGGDDEDDSAGPVAVSPTTTEAEPTDPDEDDATDDGAADETTTTTEAATTTSTTTEAPASTTTTTTTEAPASTTTTLVPLDELPPRGAVYRDGQLFLEGPVPNEEIAQAFVDRASEVIGAENVVNNYVIREDAPIPTDGNVRVEQAVLFESGSAVILPEFEPILGLGVAVMTLNPQVRMVVEGHTDDVGSDELNLGLSQRRAEAAVAWIVANGGIDPERFEAIGLGEAEPVVPNDTPENRQINRRIEVQLLDLLLAEDG